jgi:hypothetical protein
LENLDSEDSIDNNVNEKWENIKTIKETKQQGRKEQKHLQIDLHERIKNANKTYKRN